MIKLSYWVYPIFSGLVWLGTLLGLLLHWVIDTNYIHYPSMESNQTIAYISDVGAQKLKPLFITGCVLTTVFLDTSFLADRWLRHRGRLVPNSTRGEKILSGLTIFWALVGTVGLILLSIFDTARHPTLHNLFLGFFIIGYLLSAIFICWEYQRLGVRNPDHKILAISFWIKLFFILITIGLAIPFAVLTRIGGSGKNIAAILEWVIALVFSFYVFSFYVDLYPAVYTKKGGSYRTKSWDRRQVVQKMEEGTEAEMRPVPAPSPHYL